MLKCSINLSKNEVMRRISILPHFSLLNGDEFTYSNKMVYSSRKKLKFYLQEHSFSETYIGLKFFPIILKCLPAFVLYIVPLLEYIQNRRVFEPMLLIFPLIIFIIMFTLSLIINYIVLLTIKADILRDYKL